MKNQQNEQSSLEFSQTQTIFNSTAHSNKLRLTKQSFKDDVLIFPSLDRQYSQSGKTRLRYWQYPFTLEKKKTINPIEEENDRIKEKQLIKDLEVSYIQEFYDEPPRPTIGNDAIPNFYKHYKKIDRIKQQNNHHNIRDSTQTRMLEKTETLQLLPCKMSIIKETGSAQKVHLSKQRFGDNYINIITDVVSKQPFQEVNLCGNRLTQKSAIQLLPIATRNGRSLDFACNQPGSQSFVELIKVIDEKDSRIEELNFENNHLGDKTVAALCKALMNHKPLRKLNLSQNQLTDGEPISTVIRKCGYLEEILIRWNQIGPQGGASIFDALTYNESILVFDASYNGFNGRKHKCTENLVDFINQNKKLLHMDLSFNKFDRDDANKISEALNNNQIIFGFHFIGNYGYIDSRGYLRTDDQDTYILRSNPQRINSLEFTNFQKKYQNQAKDVCWICEGWHQQEFIYIPDKSIKNQNSPVYLHLSFRDYEGVLMEKTKDGKFQCQMMIPPQDIYFFFTANDIQQISPNFEIIQTTQQIFRKVLVGNRKITCQMDELNLIQKNYKYGIFEKDGTPLVEVKPRTQEKKFSPQNEKDIQWSFSISIWAKDFKNEEVILQSCFLKDWECIQISKIINNNNEQEQLKNLIWQYYKQILNTYKYYSSIKPAGDIWCIDSTVLHDFVEQTGLVDGKTLKFSDVELKFIATCSSSSLDFKGNHRNPERALVRFQFIEFLIRLSEDKYIRNKLANNYVEATRSLIQSIQHVMQFDPSQWRIEKYLTQKCDKVFKYYRPVLNYIFAELCIRKVKQGQKKFICLQELIQLCEKSQFLKDNLSEQDIYLVSYLQLYLVLKAFNLSQPLQIDELNSDLLYQMNQNEFYEAIARIAEKLSPPRFNKETPLLERIIQPLHLKIEATIVQILINCTNNSFKEDFPVPQISIFDET